MFRRNGRKTTSRTAGDSLASPDASSGGGHEVTGQSRQQLSTVNLDIDVLLSSMTEIKQTADSPQAVPVERPAETAEPAHVERVTKKKAKDPKKVACRRCRPAKATARTASGSQGIITSTCQHS